MSNSRRWRNFIIWWNKNKYKIPEYTFIKSIDEKIEEIKRNENKINQYINVQGPHKDLCSVKIYGSEAKCTCNEIYEERK